MEINRIAKINLKYSINRFFTLYANNGMSLYLNFENSHRKKIQFIFYRCHELLTIKIKRGKRIENVVREVFKR